MLSSDLICLGQKLFAGLRHDTHELFERSERFAKVEIERHFPNTLQIWEPITFIKNE